MNGSVAISWVFDVPVAWIIALIGIINIVRTLDHDINLLMSIILLHLPIGTSTCHKNDKIFFILLRIENTADMNANHD